MPRDPKCIGDLLNPTFTIDRLAFGNLTDRKSIREFKVQY